jgi:hypothetical protein
MADEQKKPEPSVRKKRQLDRMARVRSASAVERVRVLPRNVQVRALIKHPRAGAFRSSGSVEWPHDTFTKRRLRDGTVMLETSRDKPPETTAVRRSPQSAESSSTV